MKAAVWAGALCAGLISSGCTAVGVAPDYTASHVTNSAKLPAEVPSAYRCLPSGLPPLSMRPSIAYAAHCSVAAATETVRLQELAVALMAVHNGTFSKYCTGVPLMYDSSSKIGFVLTAAHCVLGGSKAAGAKVTPVNVTIGRTRKWVYQGTPADAVAGNVLTGDMRAAYVPTQYCETAQFSSGACLVVSKQNGDVAVVKIVNVSGHELRVNPQLRLAPSALHIPADAEIMALGYGLNTTPTPQDGVLYYVTYRYFATNSYAGVSSDLSLMNGYHHNGMFYAIVCQGDSGGGDFSWDGTHWNLIGVHSWGNAPCGTRSTAYNKAIDSSADVRPWEAWVQKILADDRSPTGCANLGGQYVCRSL